MRENKLNFRALYSEKMRQNDATPQWERKKTKWTTSRQHLQYILKLANVMCKSQSKVNHLNSKHLNSSTKKFKSLLCSPPLLLPSRIRFGSVFFKKKSKFRTVLFDNSFFPPLTALQNILNNRRILCVLNYDCDKYGSKMKAYENNHTIGLIGMPFGRVAKLSDQMELLLYHLHSQ